MTKMNAEQIIKLKKNMDNGERIKYLDLLFHKHFDSRSKGDMTLATTNYIEDYIDRNLTEEGILIMKLAYENCYSVGCENEIEQSKN
ncbi:hypothetical protein [Bacillus mobilis]|uniref:hypothetical protein n=1 Tax=Bacillus mobilis TaxID=2026190 RepID=UPI003680E0FA